MIVGAPCGYYVPSLIPERHRVEGDPRIVQVRTRRALDLDRLRDLYLPDLGPTIELPKASDFQYRAYCTPEQWGMALMRMALDMDYTNEKNVVLDRFKDHKLYRLYERFWNASLDVFPTGMYGRSRSGHQVRQNQFWHSHTTQTTTAGDGDRVRIADLTPHQRTLLNLQAPVTSGDRFWDEREPDVHELAAIEDEHKWALWETSEVERRSAGKMIGADHADCDHRDTRSARKRCNKRRGGRG